MPTTYYTTKQAAAKLGFSHRTIQHWIELGYFPHAAKRNPLAKNSPILIPVGDVEHLHSRLTRGRKEPAS